MTANVCPSCRRVVEPTSDFTEPRCSPVTCDAWEVVQHFDYGTREWLPGDYPSPNDRRERVAR